MRVRQKLWPFLLRRNTPRLVEDYGSLFVVSWFNLDSDPEYFLLFCFDDLGGFRLVEFIFEFVGRTSLPIVFYKSRRPNVDEQHNGVPTLRQSDRHRDSSQMSSTTGQLIFAEHLFASLSMLPLNCIFWSIVLGLKNGNQANNYFINGESCKTCYIIFVHMLSIIHWGTSFPSVWIPLCTVNYLYLC